MIVNKALNNNKYLASIFLSFRVASAEHPGSETSSEVRKRHVLAVLFGDDGHADCSEHGRVWTLKGK